ncbi:MAG: hypothetical protein HKO66_09580 [Saprospiraceae bacterium]|nr:hypothetical protein [Bacteroidia bacterium]NNL92469.1 hypothetical protein [Saprospiraceae bacterium]
MDFRIDLGLSTLEAHSFIKSQIPIPLQFALNNNGLTDADLDQVVAQRAFLRPKFGDEINLDFVNTVKVSIVDPVTLRPKEIFFMDFVNFGFKTEIELMPSLTDIKDIVINDNATIEVKLQFRQFPPQTFEMDLDMTFGAFAIE